MIPQIGSLIYYSLLVVFLIQFNHSNGGFNNQQQTVKPMDNRQANQWANVANWWESESV